MRWFDLHGEVVEFLGKRAKTPFAFASSAQTDFLSCSTFFRSWLVEGRGKPDDVQLDDRERGLVEYGRSLARDPNPIPDAVCDAAARVLTSEQTVALTAFG